MLTLWSRPAQCTSGSNTRDITVAPCMYTPSHKMSRESLHPFPTTINTRLQVERDASTINQPVKEMKAETSLLPTLSLRMHADDKTYVPHHPNRSQTPSAKAHEEQSFSRVCNLIPPRRVGPRSPALAQQREVSQQAAPRGGGSCETALALFPPGRVPRLVNNKASVPSEQQQDHRGNVWAGDRLAAPREHQGDLISTTSSSLMPPRRRLAPIGTLFPVPCCLLLWCLLARNTPGLHVVLVASCNSFEALPAGHGRFSPGRRRQLISGLVRHKLLRTYLVLKVQALGTTLFALRRDFSHCFLQQCRLAPHFNSIVSFTDEATFKRDTNSHVTATTAIQDRFSVHIWVDIVCDHLIGPYLMPQRLTGHNYCKFLPFTLPDFLEDVPHVVQKRM
ncbi:hypothetical protein PR048_005323 [Dryococelus australis]|uniref:Uncharacterized protein n=1 Tax=Dryococelus australis TaxID=614101 RepID=A0ABQ9I7V0_9NEOP|nr:hypothetical protein PR048_005323 [Dryococelus australis]